MAQDITELFLFPSSRLIVFKHRAEKVAFRTGTVVYGPSLDAADNEFLNRRDKTISKDNFIMLGKVGTLTEERAAKMFRDCRYEETVYPDYTNPDGEKLNSALDSLKSLLIAEGWPHDLNYTWILCPKPTKKLTGKKVMVQFNILDDQLKDQRLALLPVYYNEIKEDTKEITYTVEIPDHIYNFLIENPEIEARPASKNITSPIFSELQRQMWDWCNQASNLRDIDEKLTTAPRVLLIKFKSAQDAIRDSLNFGYAGKRTSITFQFFSAYKIQSHSLTNRKSLYVDQKWQSGKGWVSIKGRFAHIGDEGNNAIEINWTKEREEFLVKIEENFKALSDNLNKFLGELTEEKLDLLINTHTGNLLTYNS